MPNKQSKTKTQGKVSPDNLAPKEKRRVAAAITLSEETKELRSLKDKIRYLKGKVNSLKDEVITKVEIICEFCEYQFDADAGRYGCPNCNGEGLGDDQDAVLVGFVAIRSLGVRNQMVPFPVIETFGDAGPKQDFNALLSVDDAWKGFRVLSDGEHLSFKPYKP